jgi:hypothetical protein
MRVRRMWPVAVLLLAPVLAACGDDSAGDDGSEDATSSAAPTETTSDAATEASTPATTDTASAEPEEPTTSAAPAGLPSACDLVGEADVTEAYGVAVVQDGVGSGTTSEQDLEWTSENCSFQAEGLVEVTVKLTGPEDFRRGTFQCPQPDDIAAIVEPVDDIVGADEGWWKVSDSPPLRATMRACTTSANVDIDLDYEDGVEYEGDPRNQSVALMEKALTSLAG